LEQTNTEDHCGKLEADIELHRKIVAAAERLAKDKTTNKSVRKKRRKDFQAAAQRLKGLEKGLYRLRLSSSKPDVSLPLDNLSMSRSNAGSGFSLNSLKGWSNFSGNPFKITTKSCPVTPRGSIPDLTMTEVSDKIVGNSRYLTKSTENGSLNTDCSHHPSVSSSSGISSGSTSAHSSGSQITYEYGSQWASKSEAVGLPPAVPHRRTIAGSSRTSVASVAQRLRQEAELPRQHETPLYANVGYTSRVPYKSQYRQSNFPTLHDRQEVRSRSVLAEAYPSGSSTPPCQRAFDSSKSFVTNFGVKVYIPQYFQAFT
jgi:hypothetical protein